jgi:hypothetical protein
MDLTLSVFSDFLLVCRENTNPAASVYHKVKSGYNKKEPVSHGFFPSASDQ